MREREKLFQSALFDLLDFGAARLSYIRNVSLNDVSFDLNRKAALDTVTITYSKCGVSPNGGIWFKWNLETFNFKPHRESKVIFIKLFTPDKFYRRGYFPDQFHFCIDRFYDSSIMQFTAIRSPRLIVMLTIVL